jgi:phage/plasmid-associated DNA primase
MIVDKETLEPYTGNEYVFTTSLNAEISIKFLMDLKNGRISEDYFKDKLFYKVFRRFYEDEDWRKLKKGLGATLSPYPLKLIIVVKGDPNTGKSLLADLLSTVYGSYATSIDLEKVTGNLKYPFSLQPFLKSSVAIIDEKPQSNLKYIEKLKGLVGGGPLLIDRKYLPPVTITGKPITIMVFCNNLPVFEEVDEAFAERFLIINTTNPLDQKEIMETLREELKKEENLKDFAEFLLYCYYELKKENFKIERDIEENMELLKEAAFPLQPFIEENFIEEAEGRIEREKAYEIFVNWAKENPFKVRKIYSRRAFYDLMRKKYPDRKINGIWYFTGIKPTREAEERERLQREITQFLQ